MRTCSHCDTSCRKYIKFTVQPMGKANLGKWSMKLGTHVALTLIVEFIQLGRNIMNYYIHEVREKVPRLHSNTEYTNIFDKRNQLYYHTILFLSSLYFPSPPTWDFLLYIIEWTFNSSKSSYKMVDLPSSKKLSFCKRCWQQYFLTTLHFLHIFENLPLWLTHAYLAPYRSKRLTNYMFNSFVTLHDILIPLRAFDLHNPQDQDTHTHTHINTYICVYNFITWKAFD